MRTPRLFVPLVLLGLLLLYVVGVLGRDLWAPDEPRVAAISKEVSQGAWILPRLNQEPVLTTPLYFWSTAVVYKGLGTQPPEIGRIVAAAYALGTLLVTFLLGRAIVRRFSSELPANATGALCALCMGVTTLGLLLGNRMVVDGALGFFSTAAVYFFFLGLSGERSKARILCLLCGYAATAFAFLAKGVVGIAAPGLGFLLILIACGRLRDLFRSHLWLGLVCLAAIAGPWLGLLHHKIGEAGARDLITQDLRHFDPRPTLDGGAWYGYAILAPAALGVTTLFLLAAIFRRLQRRRDLDPAERFATNFGVAWFLAGVVLLSLARDQRMEYLAPFAAGACVAAGLWASVWIHGGQSGSVDRSLGGLVGVLLLIASVGLPIATVVFLPARLGIGGTLLEVLTGGAILAGGAGALIALWMLQGSRREEPARVFLGSLYAVLVFTCAIKFLLAPIVGEQVSLAGPALRIDQSVPGGQTLYAMRPDDTTKAMMSYYIGRRVEPLSGPAELQAKLRENRWVWVLTVEDGENRKGRGSEGWKSSRTGSIEHLRHDIVMRDDPGPLAPVFTVMRFSGR